MSAKSGRHSERGSPVKTCLAQGSIRLSGFGAFRPSFKSSTEAPITPLQLKTSSFDTIRAPLPNSPVNNSKTPPNSLGALLLASATCGARSLSYAALRPRCSLALHQLLASLTANLLPPASLRLRRYRAWHCATPSAYPAKLHASNGHPIAPHLHTPAALFSSICFLGLDAMRFQVMRDVLLRFWCRASMAPALHSRC